MELHTKKIVLAAALAAILTSACAKPKTTDEFLKAYGDSMWVGREIFDLDIPFEEARSRLIAMTSQCYNVKIQRTESGNMGGVVRRDSITYTTEVKNKPDFFQLGLRRKASFDDGETMILMVSQLKKQGPKKVRVEVFAPKMGYGNMTEDTANWVRGAKKLCPELKN